MITATESFIESFDRWLATWKSGDLRSAQHLAENLNLHGDLLAIRPEFGRNFSKRSSMPTRDALRSLCHFLACACECRREVAEQTR